MVAAVPTDRPTTGQGPVALSAGAPAPPPSCPSWCSTTPPTSTRAGAAAGGVRGRGRGHRLDLAGALPRDLTTFRYPGSLTTAPYTEGVSWLVLARHRTLATATVRGVRRLFPDGDARELQPLRGRVVRLRRQ